MKTTALVLLLLSCSVSDRQTAQADSGYKLDCQYAGDGVYRCENKEAVCYKYESHGISCFQIN